MNTASKIGIGLAIAAGVVGIGLLVGWWGSRSAAPPAPPASHTQRPGPAASPRPANPTPSPAPVTPVLATNSSPATAPASTQPTNAAADWEDKVDEILGSDIEDTNKVKQLFALFPTLPEDGQVEVILHLSNLVPDDDYSQLGNMLKDPKLPKDVLDLLLNDALNRPNSAKLPLLLEVARDPQNPEFEDARDIMELFLEEDDPAKWPDKLKEFLKENPD
jgi:hypothetical protein